MFLLPSLVLGLALAVLLGGRPSRLLDVRLRLSWMVVLALADQVALFSKLGAGLGDPARRTLHLASYVLLIGFAAANLRVRQLIPVLLGMMLNAVAITANGGRMPVSPSAARAIGLGSTDGSNVSEGARHLRFLGDVFALPPQLPLANVFSVGDILIGFGMLAFVVVASVDEGQESLLRATRLLEPFRTVPYRRLALGKLVSQFGDWVTLAALIGWVYESTGSTGQVAGVLLLRLAPPILGASVAGVVVDRLPKQRLLVWIELGRGVAVAGALGAVLSNNRPGAFAAIACSGALAAMTAAAVPSFVPSLLPADQLASANAGLGIAENVAMAVGALTAGLALSSVGAAAALAADVVTFATAALVFATLRLAPVPLVPRGKSAPSGLRYLLGRRRLLFLVLCFGAATLATGLTNATLPRYLGHLGLGVGSYAFGLAAISTGLALGRTLVGFARVESTAGRWIGVGLTVMAGLFFLLALTAHAPTVVLLLGAIGFVDGTTDVLFETVVQREADPRYYGSIFGFAGAFVTTTMIAAVSVSPLANELLPARAILAGAGCFLLVAGAIGLVGMRRPSAAAPAAATA